MTRFLNGVSAAALGLSAGLCASSATAADAPVTAASATTIGELIVTAEKREQKLESVPVAISAYTADQRDLVGISSVQDLSDFTPGLAYSSLDNRPYLRGVGRNTDNLATESGVAVYYDGVYNGANASTILQSDSLFVDQIEVLRGPQSTLYGRNADGGAINYISKRPTKTLQSEVRVGAESFDKYWGEAVVSGPISESLRFRLGGNYTRQTGGFFHNTNGSPEGGTVAQGGNGTSYHVELQLEGEIGEHLDWWAKAATSDYDVSWHTQSTLGPLPQAEFPAGSLTSSGLFGLCALPGGAGGLGCADPGASPDRIVPGSVVALAHTITSNPSDRNSRDFDADFLSRSHQGDDKIFATSVTYHLPAIDVKYLFGYQSFLYNLQAPFSTPGPYVSVESYQLAGPAAPNAECAAIFNNAGCTQPLTIVPAHTQFTFIEDEQFFSHELNFTSTDKGPIQWIAGLYWYHEHYNQPIDVLLPNQPQLASPVNFDFSPAPANPTRSIFSQDTNLKADSYAGFGQVDWQATDTLKVTAGLRYTADHKSGVEHFRAQSFNLIPGFDVGTLGANVPAVDLTGVLADFAKYPGAKVATLDPKSGVVSRDLDAWWHAVTGTAGVEWTPQPDTLVYLKYSRGYKTGGFNSGTIAAHPETLPEFVDAYEAGLKKVFGATLQVNAAAFYYNYRNDQVPLTVQPPTGVAVTDVFNVPLVHTYGFEWESIWRPVDPLTVSLNYAYLSSKVADTGGNCFQDSNDPAATQPGANTAGCPAGTGFQNTTGQSLPQAARNKVSLNGLYRLHFDAGELVLSGTYIWKDAQFSSLFNRSYNRADPYSQVNARATWIDAKARYKVIAFADNLFDTKGSDGVGGQLVSPPGAPEVIDKLFGFTAPRTYGVEFQYRFN